MALCCVIDFNFSDDIAVIAIDIKQVQNLPANVGKAAKNTRHRHTPCLVTVKRDTINIRHDQFFFSTGVKCDKTFKQVN